MSDTHVSTSGVGFTGLVTVLFVGLKLGGVIGWSWWWVLAPLWLPLAFAASLALVFGLGFLIYHVCR